MSAQLQIEPVVMQGVSKPVLEYYAGYCFGWRNAWLDLSRWVHACVVTPRYIERATAEVDPAIPLIIDNGAYSAWHNDADLTLLEQVDELERAILHAGPERVRFVVWPDVVGSPRRTWQRINRMFRCFNHRLATPMVPVQEGMCPLEQAQVAAYRDGAVFIGGETRRWKLETAAAIRARFRNRCWRHELRHYECRCPSLLSLAIWMCRSACSSAARTSEQTTDPASSGTPSVDDG